MRKLLQLGSSNNKNESLLALKKAAEIAQKYQIEEEDINNENNFKTLVIKSGKKKTTRILSPYYCATDTVFFCSGYFFKYF